MTNPEVAILMLSLFIVMVLLGFPVAFTLLAMGIGFGYYAYYEAGSIETFTDVFNNKIFYLLNQNTYSVMENDTLVAIPLFLFMGYVVERANIVNKLFYSLQMAARNMPGSMAIAALVTCAVFSTASGIVGAVVTLMGLLAFPAMVKAHYDKSFASGVICSGGTLGILIPPSIMLIVYAAIAELSPLRLYAAAIIPGFMLAGAGSTGNGGPAPGSIFKPDIHFDSGISTTIEDFPTVHVSNRGHVLPLPRSGNYRGSNPPGHCYR